MKIRIAIVEDNTALREIVSDWITQTKEMCLVAAHKNAEDAMRDLPAQKPDVVLVDINLPGADGIACVKKLKPLLPATQFLMVTVYEDAQRIFSALAAGASGYLLKRSSREQLLNAITEVRQGGSPMSAQIARKVVQHFQQTERPNETEALSPREHEILAMLSKGLLYKEIADRLESSVYTINSHVRRIYEKLHVRSRSQAIAKFLKR